MNVRIEVIDGRVDVRPSQAIKAQICGRLAEIREVARTLEQGPLSKDMREVAAVRLQGQATKIALLADVVR